MAVVVAAPRRWDLAGRTEPPRGLRARRRSPSSAAAARRAMAPQALTATAKVRHPRQSDFEGRRSALGSAFPEMWAQRGAGATRFPPEQKRYTARRRPLQVSLVARRGCSRRERQIRGLAACTGVLAGSPLTVGVVGAASSPVLGGSGTSAGHPQPFRCPLPAHNTGWAAPFSSGHIPALEWVLGSVGEF